MSDVNDITGIPVKYNINILLFNCGKQVKQAHLKSPDIKFNRNRVVYKDGFYCCPDKCKRNDE
jgi:hypothetical protein